MNDFTKEELIELQESLHYWHEGIETKLTHKIQSMIDNYCEHEDTCRNCDCTTECNKCGRIWG